MPILSNFPTTDSTKMDKANPTGTGSFSLNRRENTIVAEYSFAEGYNTAATAQYSHAEGYNTTAGYAAHAEGYNASATAQCSHAEGWYTVANAQCSHAEGDGSAALGEYSHAEGERTSAASASQHVQGRYNIKDSSGVYAHIVGNGTSTAKSNAHTLDWDGNAWFAGDVYVGGTGQDDESATSLTTTITNLGSSLETKTSTSILPNNGGEIKTKFRIAQKGYTSGATWYYKICDLPINNEGNYASAIVSGRIGGWTSGNLSYINALVWNRDTPGIALLDIAGSAGAMSSVWNIADLVLYTNDTSATAKNTATLYVKCYNYFVFDLDLELFQSAASITYDGSYLTTTPSGTLAAQSSTTTKRVEVVNGKLYVNGSEMATTSHTHNSIKETNAGLEQKFWRGTKSEFDALSTKSDDTMYIITDDDDTGETMLNAAKEYTDTKIAQTITYGTEDLTDGESTLTTGVLYCVYE